MIMLRRINCIFSSTLMPVVIVSTPDDEADQRNRDHRIDHADAAEGRDDLAG